jgi:SAM-dependent methyltransferase
MSASCCRIVRDSKYARELRLPAWEASWPQRRGRRPRLTDAYYLHYSALALSLARARDRYATRRIDVLDVGCGHMPYYPLFEAVAADYVGTDVTPDAGPRIRHVCPVERLTVPDASFDLVICTQVLEHVRRPEEALAEIARVLRPGGHAFISTHGVWPFHPYPEDYWRWTQQGLEALFEDVPGLTLRELVPHRGTASCIALMVNFYVEIFALKTRLKPLGAALAALLNIAGLVGDRGSRFLYPNSGTLIHNFLAVAERVSDRHEPAVSST